MIVRINQIDPQQAERHAGWYDAGPAGPIECRWPQGTLAFELLILPTDERHQPLARTFRQGQLRQLIPDVISAMQAPGETTVVRLEGPLAAGEMIDAFKHLTDAHGSGRYSISAAEKFTDDPLHPMYCIRLHVTLDRLVTLCADPNVGLDRSVRMRVFGLPEQLVNPLLDIADGADERWAEVLAHSSLVLANTRALQSLQLVTGCFSPDETRARLTRKLVGSARS